MADGEFVEDFNKLVKLDITLDELQYLQKLLNYEIVYQIRTIFEAKQEISEKVIKLLSIFDTYRSVDDQILDFSYAFSQSKSNAVKNNIKVKNLIVVNKNICKFYKILCFETTKLILPDDMKVLVNKYNQVLLDKINMGLENSVDAQDLAKSSKEVDNFFSPRSEDIMDKTKEENIVPNIFFKKASA